MKKSWSFSVKVVTFSSKLFCVYVSKLLHFLFKCNKFQRGEPIWHEKLGVVENLHVLLFFPIFIFILNCFSTVVVIVKPQQLLPQLGCLCLIFFLGGVGMKTQPKNLVPNDIELHSRESRQWWWQQSCKNHLHNPRWKDEMMCSCCYFGHFL